MRSLHREQTVHAPVPVVLIEDNRLACEQLAALLASQPDLKVVASAGSAATGLARARETRPQVTLVDAGLGWSDILLCLQGARDMAPRPKVILMNVPRVPEDVVAFIEGGANGFILKDATADDFLGTIRLVARGIDVVPSALASLLFSQLANQALVPAPPALPPPAVPAPPPRLTRREREIESLIAHGLANKEIAQRLHIATHTVKTHVHKVLKKLALHSRLQLAAHTLGALRLDPDDSSAANGCASPPADHRLGGHPMKLERMTG